METAVIPGLCLIAFVDILIVPIATEKSVVSGRILFGIGGRVL